MKMSFFFLSDTWEIWCSFLMNNIQLLTLRPQKLQLICNNYLQFL